jgi:hypothetical protein
MVIVASRRAGGAAPYPARAAAGPSDFRTPVSADHGIVTAGLPSAYAATWYSWKMTRRPFEVSAHVPKLEPAVSGQLGVGPLNDGQSGLVPSLTSVGS